MRPSEDKKKVFDENFSKFYIFFNIFVFQWVTNKFLTFPILSRRTAARS